MNEQISPLEPSPVGADTVSNAKTPERLPEGTPNPKSEMAPSSTFSTSHIVVLDSIDPAEVDTSDDDAFYAWIAKITGLEHHKGFEIYRTITKSRGEQILLMTPNSTEAEKARKCFSKQVKCVVTNFSAAHLALHAPDDEAKVKLVEELGRLSVNILKRERKVNVNAFARVIKAVEAVNHQIDEASRHYVASPISPDYSGIVYDTIAPHVQKKIATHCVFFKRGNCRDGPNCKFYHEGVDADPNAALYQPQQRRALCKYFARGSCAYGERCQYSHDLSAYTTREADFASQQPQTGNGGHLYAAQYYDVAAQQFEIDRKIKEEELVRAVAAAQT